MRRGQTGFTLLEVLVATLLMGIAVTGLLASLRTSLTNAARLTEYDRAAVLARRRMDELLAVKRLPKNVPLQGTFAPGISGGVESGWQALVTTFESSAPTGAPPPEGSRVLERIQLEVWWMRGSEKRSIQIEAYRGARFLAAMPPGGVVLP